MSYDEFAQVMAYLEAGCGKEFSEETAAVYFDLLGDLPLAALQYAARRALLESKYPTLPTVGNLRELATAAVEGLPMPWSEAWIVAKRCAPIMAFELTYMGPGPTGVPGVTVSNVVPTATIQAALRESIPPAIARAAAAIGWREIADPKNAEATRAHFRGAYEGLAAQEHVQQLLPPSVQTLLLRVAEAASIEPPSIPLRRPSTHNAATTPAAARARPPDLAPLNRAAPAAAAPSGGVGRVQTSAPPATRPAG